MDEKMISLCISYPSWGDHERQMLFRIADYYPEEDTMYSVPFESVHITHPQKITSFDETLIIAQIQSHAKGDMILAPMWIREVISFCSQNQYYKVQQAITASICNGRIRKGLVMYLNQFRRTFING